MKANFLTTLLLAQQLLLCLLPQLEVLQSRERAKVSHWCQACY